MALTEGNTRGGTGAVKDTGENMRPTSNPPAGTVQKKKQLTPQEWHEMAARTLRVENEKLLGTFVKQIQDDLKASEERESRRRENYLRDTFAMSAITGLLGNFEAEDITNTSIIESMAVTAYAVADAMIEARKT